ncbi:type VI secretion system protein IglI family protein [Sorangium sp. So ce1099]|uniref:type VI secretion system protein IglI family protein n=1 Tax=Sorangium sp. So ce1099 TaxID=3133331 RepID=UPI003F5EE3D5
MTNLAHLEGPFPAGDAQRAAAAADRVSRIVRLSNQGEYEQAAAAAEALIAERVYDLHAIVRFLFGAFVEHGFTALPKVFDCLAGTLRERLGDAGLDRKGQKEIETGVAWFCRTLKERVDFHHGVRDDAFKAWVAACDPAVVDAIRAASQRLAAEVGQRLPGSRAVESLAGLDGYFNGTLRGLVVKPAPRPSPPPRPAPPPPPAPAATEEPAPAEPEEEPPPAPTRAARAAPSPGAPRSAVDRRRARAPEGEASPAGELDSPALRALRVKMDAFAALMERGDFARAAVVASDLNAIVESFDPRVYFPRLFARYFKRFAGGVGELAPHLEAADSVAWRALDQLYRVDLDAFLEEE